jgi:uncharacterized protein with FMN-binding domain
MRRVAVTIVLTAVGLVLLLQFKTHAGQAHTGRPATLAPTVPRSTSASPARRNHPTRSPATVKSAVGRVVQTHYGPVQVKITERAGHLTNIDTLQLPVDDPRSVAIANQAVPILRSEALRAGSAHIDVVSGATYTSDGYAQSLQSALDGI